eukprot:1151315-Pelagomonas_calceolata.AAC.13
MQAVKILPTSIKERGYLRPRHHVSPHPRETKEISQWGSGGLLESASGAKERKGKGYTAIPSYVGSLAEAKKVPVTKPFSKRSRLTSSRPDAILITPYKAKPTSSPSTSCSHHHAERSRHNPTPRATTANCARQPHQLNVNQRHVHFKLINRH